MNVSWADLRLRAASWLFDNADDFDHMDRIMVESGLLGSIDGEGALIAFGYTFRYHPSGTLEVEGKVTIG